MICKSIFVENVKDKINCIIYIFCRFSIKCIDKRNSFQVLYVTEIGYHWPNKNTRIWNGINSYCMHVTHTHTQICLEEK
jgi:hypothetical protein